MGPTVVPAPTNVWRIARRPDPLSVRTPLPSSDLTKSGVGNRFDSPVASYGVLYFGKDLETCYAEVLARFRPDLRVIAEIKDEWKKRGFVELGSVPADWRFQRVAVRVTLQGSLPFLDLESPDTLEHLRVTLADRLVAFGYTDFDMGVVCGTDRRVTRLISQWAYDELDDDGRSLYGGIRYMSRVAPEYECWAAFEDCSIEVLEELAISEEDPNLRKIAERYGLKVL